MTGPLAGYRVVDFSTALAGPWAAGMLADQGADVIKVEQPGTGDTYRYSGTLHNGVSAMFHLANRGKRSIAINLRQPEGRMIALDLAARADVVIQNYRPGVAERLGVGYEQIRERSRDVVFVAVSGFGPHGPYRDRPAFDSVIQAASGMCASQAAPGTNQPVFIEQTIADKLTSMAAAQAALSGLLARERGFGGQRIDVPMLDVSVAFLWMDHAGRQTFLDADPTLSSTVTGGRRTIQLADGWCVVALATDAAFMGACAVFGLDPDAYPELQSATGRANHRDSVMAFMTAMEERSRRVSVADASEGFLGQSVPFAVVRSISEIADDPQVVASGLLRESVHPTAGRIREPRLPIRFSSTEASRVGASPGLGEHTDEILKELGRSDADDLRSRGVVA